MRYYLRLKGIAFGGLVGLFLLVHSLSTSSMESPPTDYARYAVIAAQPIVTPTSEAVPFPVCRTRYINLSADRQYPIPHWIYSLPREADKALVLAIARNESRFQLYARSGKGAVGLMQLMPATARYMAGKGELGHIRLAGTTQGETASRTPRTPFDFRDPYVSLAVGYRYIRYLQEKPYIKGNLTYMLAAYNAGPGNLLEWKRSFGRVGDAGFIARIPYRETRRYIQKVTHDYKRYQELLPPIQETVWMENDGC